MKTKTMTIKEEWIAEGIEKGSQQKGFVFARKLILRNMPLEEICELTDLSMEEVMKLAAEISNH